MNDAASANQIPDRPVPLAQEQAVVARLKAGDRSAFSDLYGWYAQRLFAVVARR